MNYTSRLCSFLAELRQSEATWLKMYLKTTIVSSPFSILPREPNAIIVYLKALVANNAVF